MACSRSRAQHGRAWRAHRGRESLSGAGREAWRVEDAWVAQMGNFINFIGIIYVVKKSLKVRKIFKVCLDGPNTVQN